MVTAIVHDGTVRQVIDCDALKCMEGRPASELDLYLKNFLNYSDPQDTPDTRTGETKRVYEKE